MRILIIDDNEHHAELAARRLESEGWQVVTIARPEPDASYADFDFILLDYHMPGFTGIDVLKKFQELQNRTPVIFMTGHGNEMVASQAMKLGAYDYVVKDTKLIYLDRIPAVIREAKAKHDLMETNRFLVQELRKANDRLQRLTLTDEMTNIYNYRFLKSQLETEIRRSERYGNPLVVCLIDVDHFKEINDEFGHPLGDRALKHVADILTANIRSVDFVGRYAGDEFLIIFPDTQIADAINLCERIRKELAGKPIEAGDKKRVITLSIGIADFLEGKRSTVDSLIAAADRCLYTAKKMGRDRIESTRSKKPALTDVSATSASV